MEQNQEQKQGTLVKVTFIVGIAAAVFVLLAFAASGLLWVSDVLGIAGIILAIVAFVKKLEPKKNILIGGGLSLFATILSLSGVIGATEKSDELSESDIYSEYSDYDYTPSVDNKLKKDAIDFATRLYNAEKNNDKIAVEKVGADVVDYLNKLSNSDQELFNTYASEHYEFLKNGVAAKSSKSSEDSSSVEIEEIEENEGEEKAKKAVKAASKDDDDDDDDDDKEYASSEYEAGYKPSNSEIEELANKYAQKELGVYDYDDYEDRAAKLDEELESKVSHWTKSAKERVFDLQEKKFDALVDKRDKKEAASDDDE